MSPNVFSVGGLPREAKGHLVQFIEVHENVLLEPRLGRFHCRYSRTPPV